MKRTIIIKDAVPPPPPPVTGVAHPIPRPAADRRVGALRCGLSLGCALMADGLQWVFPPLWVFCDGAMAVALLLIWGPRWEIALAVLPELIPGISLFPTWTLFVGYLIVSRRKRKG